MSHTSGSVHTYLHGKAETLLLIPDTAREWGKQQEGFDMDGLEMELEVFENAELCDPSDICTLYFGTIDVEDYPPEWLEQAAARFPELEIAFVAELYESTGGGALYAWCSPAGSASLIPEDWNGKWFPWGKAIAGWDFSIEEAGEIDLGLPDWVNYSIDAEDDEEVDEYE